MKKDGLGGLGRLVSNGLCGLNMGDRRDLVIEKRRLAGDIMAEVDLDMDGYRWIGWRYAVRAWASIYTHVCTGHADGVGKDGIIAKVAVQLLFSSGRNKPYLHVQVGNAP